MSISSTSPAPVAPPTPDPLAATVRATGQVTADEVTAYRRVVRSVGATLGHPGADLTIASPVHPFVFAWNTFDAFVGTVTAPPGADPRPPSVLHLSQEVHQRRPLRPGEPIVHELDIAGVRRDRRGVRLSLRSTLVGADGQPFAELLTGLLALAAEYPPDRGAIPAHPAPAPAEWDTVVTRAVPAELPARYAAVSGDANPIHLDPAAAAAAGLPGVIAHGMSVVAIVAETAIDCYAAGDAARVRSLGCRFSAPVVPGEPFDVYLAPDDAGTTIAFTCKVGRGPALKGGWVELTPGGPDAG
jgi:acyl dehydratase